MKKKVFCFLLGVIQLAIVSAQDERGHYPGLLKNAFFSVSLGYINTPYSNKELQAHYQAGKIANHHFGLQLVLFGHQFSKYFSSQISYMKATPYAAFTNVNGDKAYHSVWLHYGTLTVKEQLPITEKLTVYGKTGLNIVSRKGFTDSNHVSIIKNANYGTIVLSTGFEYHLTPKWDILLGATYIPPRYEIYNQPHTIFYSAGMQYNLTPLSAATIKRNEDGKYIFHKRLLQLAYSTNAFGYGTNNFFSEKFPIFWGGHVQVKQGFFVRYQQNVFHTHKVFSLDVGSSAGYWQSNRNKEKFYTFSLFPLLRFTLVRSELADFYLFYSAAGPSYISKPVMDNIISGKHFTFEDMMGFGVYLGNQKHFNAEVHINHYSNGNMFPFNSGVKVPMTFSVGYAF